MIIKRSLESRGYLQAGSFVPEVALDDLQANKQNQRDFMNAGSDVVLAFTDNAHREKIRITIVGIAWM